MYISIGSKVLSMLLFENDQVLLAIDTIAELSGTIPQMEFLCQLAIQNT